MNKVVESESSGEEYSEEEEGQLVERAPEICQVFGDGDLPDPIATFEDALEIFPEELIKPMTDAGFKKPTGIQSHAWPILMAGRDLVGVAKTGSGKTLAFLLPCFCQLLRDPGRQKADDVDANGVPLIFQKQVAGAYSPPILAMAPSRELAAQ